MILYPINTTANLLETSSGVKYPLIIRWYKGSDGNPVVEAYNQELIYKYTPFPYSKKILQNFTPEQIESTITNVVNGFKNEINLQADPPINFLVEDFNYSPPTNLSWETNIDNDYNPQEKNKEREEIATQNSQSIQSIEKTEIPVDEIEKSSPDSLKAKGSALLPTIIFGIGSRILVSLIPYLENLIREFIEEQVDGEDLCPPPEVLQNLINQRNLITSQLNKAVNEIDNIGQQLTGLSNFLNIITTTITTLDIISIAHFSIS